MGTVLPEEWRYEPLKYHCTFGKGLAIQKTDLTDTGIPVISYGQIHSKSNVGVHLAEVLLRFVPRKLAPVYSSASLRCGDVVYADTSEDVKGLGNAVLIDTENEVYAGYHTLICRPDGSSLCGRYLAYLSQSDWWRAQIRNWAMGVKVFSVTQSIMSHVWVPLPPKNEQLAIASVLDDECSKLLYSAGQIEKQISTLERYRASVIHEAVTKGLDPAAPTKPSGVDWIGDIPVHWSQSRLRYLASFESGATPSKDNLDYWNGDIPWVSSMEVKSDVLQDTSLHITQDAVNSCSTRLLPAGTLVLVVRSGILQHTVPVALLGKPMTINQDVKAIRFASKMLSKFFYYFVKGNNDSLLKALLKDKSTVDNINFEYLKSLPVQVPPISEQEEIVNYLDDRTAAIDAVLETKRKQLGVLKARRQSLIYEYVTGKRRVTLEA